jgi:hypothetical protein
MQLAFWSRRSLGLPGVGRRTEQPPPPRGQATAADNSAEGRLSEAVSGAEAHDGPEPCAITWAQLVELEPRLEQLLWRARLAGAGCRTRSDVHQVFGPVRNELAELIGFHGVRYRHPVLGSTEAYQVAYWKLHEAVAGLLPGRAGRPA